MLFNSFEFIFLFLPLTLIVYFFLNRHRLTLAAKSWLVFASLFFYSWWNVKYLPLILGSILFNYAIGTNFTRVKESKRKWMLVIGICSNIGLLAVFKYTDFFISDINQLFAAHFELIHIGLPLGISFFTFTQIAYLADSYYARVEEYDLLNYALFVTFFPHLIAGPIIHHREMMPQFVNLKNKLLNNRNLFPGILLFFIGLFKKTSIADVLAQWANNGFDNSVSLTLVEAWVTSLSYTFEIYFDFSGYTDMALGAALMFNIRLPINFNSPYKATSIQDFWRRWHITLSRFLRDYIYIPLGGNREGDYRTYSNMMITFLVGGLWHGAGWTFVLWGLLHGTALIIQKAWQKSGIRLNSVVSWFITFNFVNLTWIFFRANNWHDAVKVLKGMFNLNGAELPNLLLDVLPFLKSFFHGTDALRYVADGTFMGFMEALCFIAVVFTIAVFFTNTNQLSYRQSIFVFSVTFVFSIQNIFFRQIPSEFLYFRF
ncbi:MAG: MBOAT family protein [Nitrospirae bacterium]|nr:MBOAT family protein [Nitrospirota bacterium]